MRWRRRDEAVTAEWARDRQRDRLEIMTALVQAQERRHEVLEAIATAPSEQAAQEAVARLLGLPRPAVQAVAVLDMQLSRMTEESRARMRSECDQLRAALDESG